MELRSLSVADAPGVVDVFQRSRSESMPWLPVLHSGEEDHAFFAGEIDGGHAWGAFDDGQLTGFVISGNGWIRHLYVAPDHQDRGVGSALLERALQEESSPVHLWAFEANTRAIGFYRGRGFAVVERTMGEGNEEGLPDVRMRHPGSGQARA